MAKDAALVEEATRLYVEEGLTLEEVSKAVEVSDRTVSHWSSKYGWVERRRQYRRLNRDLDELVRKIKIRLAEQLISDSIDPQMIYALARGLAVLRPAAAVELRNIEKAEKEAETLSPEEKREKVKQAIEGIYGINL